MSEIERMKKKLDRGQITRREFLSRMSAIGATAVLPAMYSGNALAGPKKGGRLRVGLGHGSTTDGLDPATYENGFTADVNYAIHNHMGEVDDAGIIAPELAESWEATNGAKTWIFNLRKGVEFSNGKTMDADDIVASFQHHMGETKSPAKALLAQVESMRKDGPHQVIFELAGGNADFSYIAADYHIAIKPSKDGKIDAADGIGSGPFVLEDFDPGVRAFFKKNPNYWKEGRGHFDELELLSIIDPTARTNALTTGEVDVMDRPDLKTASRLGKKPGIVIEETTGYLHYTFPMRTDTAPFDDNNVRMALKHAVNREEIVEKILYGHGTVGNDHPIAPSVAYHAADLEQRHYDPDKAKFYAKKAGGISVKLSAADAAFAGAVDAATLYKEHAAAAGIEIEVVREPNDGYWSNVWMKKAWGACYWGGRPTQDWMFTTAYQGGGSWNDTFWAHTRFDELLISARAETDSEKRRAMYFEMQQIVRDEGGVVVPMFANNVWAASDKIAHGSMAQNWTMDGNKFMEKWWFA